MTADQYLYGILLREAVDAGPNSPLLGLQAALMPILRQWAGDNLLGVYPSGSFKKGTAVRSGTDIDLFLSLSEQTNETLKEVYDRLFDCLTSAGYAPRRQNVSLNIKVAEKQIPRRAELSQQAQQRRSSGALSALLGMTKMEAGDGTAEGRALTQGSRGAGISAVCEESPKQILSRAELSEEGCRPYGTQEEILPHPALRLPAPIRAKAVRIGDPVRLRAGLDYAALAGCDSTTPDAALAGCELVPRVRLSHGSGKSQKHIPRRAEALRGMTKIGAGDGTAGSRALSSPTYSVDLVPGKRQNLLSDDHSLYRRKADTWTKTNVLTHARTVINSGRADEIRILKLWRNQKGLDFPSFYLELSVIRALAAKPLPGLVSYNPQSSLSQRVMAVFDYLVDSFPAVRIADPANGNNIISDDLTAQEKARISAAAWVAREAAREAAHWEDVVR